MKKMTAMLLALVLVLALAACGGSGDGSGAPSVEKDSLGAALWNEFEAYVTAHPEATVQEISDILAHSSALPYPMSSSAVDPSYLPGFAGEYQPAGYREAYAFGPDTTAVAFQGYIFQVEEGADAQALADALEENADLAWNICMAADQVVVGTVGDLVFFLMCPMSMA